MMTMKDNDVDLREKLNDSVPSMPYEEVLDQISKAYGAPNGILFSSPWRKLVTLLPWVRFTSESLRAGPP